MLGWVWPAAGFAGGKRRMKQKSSTDKKDGGEERENSGYTVTPGPIYNLGTYLNPSRRHDRSWCLLAIRFVARRRK